MPTPPASRYQDLRLPDGTHTGVRVDVARWIIQVKRRGVLYYFDLAHLIAQDPIASGKPVCYDEQQVSAAK